MTKAIFSWRPFRSIRLPLIVMLLAVSGCVSYKPEPLSPSEAQARLKRFSLADFAEEYAKVKPAEILPDISEGLGPDEVGAAALAFNPSLRAKEGVACGQLITAGLYPNPTFDNRSLLGSQNPPHRKLIEGSLSFEVLRRNEISAEKQAKCANVQAVHYEVLNDEWKTVSDARNAYWTVVAQRERLRLNKEELEISERLLNGVKARMKHGAATALDINLSELQHIKLQAEAQKLEADAASAERALRLAIGLPYDAEIKLRIAANPLARAARPWNTEQLLATLTDSAVMKAAEWRYKESEGELRAAVARQYPGLKLGPASELDFDGHMWSSLTGFVASIDLPFFHRNQGEVKEKCAARDVARAEYNAKLLAAQGALADAAMQVENIEKRLAMQEKELLPKAEENLKLTEKSYNAGDIAGYELLTARSTFIDIQKSYLDLLIDYRTSLQAAEAALGRRLDDISKLGKNP